MERADRFPIRSSEDVLNVRQEVRARAIQLGFSIVDQTKFVTAASEIARNTLDHGQGGTVLMQFVERDGEQGLRLTFEDHGPGIANIEDALKDGFTTTGGFGLGLPGAKRLSDDFFIESRPALGTKVIIVRWK